MRFTRPVLLAVAVLVLAAAGWWGYSTYFASGSASPEAGPPQARGPAARGPGRPVAVNVAPVRKEVLSDRIEAIGTTSANESITVTARAQGIVRSINFDDGQTVKKGDEIAAIDAGEQDAQLNVQLANLEEQRKSLQRISGLAQSQNVSQARLDEQIAAVRKAEANVAAARARVADYRITAPFSGILGTRKVSIGALATPGTAITTLDDISVVKLDFAIPETFISTLKPGLLIEATTAAYPGELFKGEVMAVDSRVDPATRSVAIRAVIRNEDLRLRPGMLMIVELIKNRRDSLMIPEQALMPEPGKQFVYIIDKQNTAARVQVVIGARRLGFVEILEGLSEGDLVVTDGTLDVRPGSKVDVLNREKLGTAPASAGAPPRTG